MRRFLLLVCVGAAGVVLLASGAASAYEPAPDPEPTMRCDRSGGSCVGTDHRDAIYGSKVADDIRARAGQDWANARPGNDAAYGGPGRDDLRGGTGHDDLHGGSLRDGLDGDSGRDTLHGGSWGDSLDGDADDDTVRGGLGGDSLDGDDGDDALYGGPGNDRVHSTGSGVDRLYGGDGDDHLYVWEDAEQDYFYCGQGHDIYYLRDADSSHHVSASCEEERLMFIPPANPGDPVGILGPPLEFYYD